MTSTPATIIGQYRAQYDRGHLGRMGRAEIYYRALLRHALWDDYRLRRVEATVCALRMDQYIRDIGGHNHD